MGLGVVLIWQFERSPAFKIVRQSSKPETAFGDGTGSPTGISGGLVQVSDAVLR
jgi:hypothetical protein